jgi:hypothetical protein
MVSPVHVTQAQLPLGKISEDKVITADSAVIMLDGASAFRAVPVAAAVYADCLGRHLHHGLSVCPGDDLSGILGDAISRTARELGLSPGNSPSSTVTIIRQAGHDADVLVLGDGLVVLPTPRSPTTGSAAWPCRPAAPTATGLPAAPATTGIT